MDTLPPKISAEEERFLDKPTTVAKNTRTLPERIRLIWNNITIEPMLAAFVIPCALSALASQNLALEKACRVNLNYSDEICDALTRRETANYTNEEKMVQQLVAGMANWKTLLQSGLPCLLIMFWGSWSDRHGRRKPCMLIPVIGELLTALSLILCVYFKNTPMEIPAIAESIIPALAGGWSTMMMGAFSYVADVTTEDERTVRIGMVNLCLNLGIPIGMAFSGLFLKKFGFYGVFSITASLHFCALIYGLFVVKESRTKEKRPINDTSKKGIVADFFDKKHVIDTFKVAFKSDNKERRFRVIMLFIVLVVVEGPMFGEMSVFYLFTRYRFNWDEVDYSIFSTYAMGTGLLGVMFSVGVLSHRLKIADALVGMLSSLSKVLSSFVYAFAVTPWQLYLGPIVEILNGTSFIAMRSIATKLVGADEFGKVNSLFGVVAALVPVIYTPMYASMYIATLHILPGAFFLLGGTMTMPAVGIFLWLYVVNKKDQKKLDAKDEEMKITSEHQKQFDADLKKIDEHAATLDSTEKIQRNDVELAKILDSDEMAAPKRNGINT